MIVSRAFVWQHFPKCGGHAVEQALRHVAGRDPDIVFDPQSRAEGWHDSVADRGRRDAAFDLGGRVVISGLRRLPYWMLSRVHYEASRPPYLTVTREMLCRGEFFHQNGAVGSADDYARHYGAGRVDRWIRTEHLSEDFERAFVDLIPSRLAKAAVRKARRLVNGTPFNYLRSLDFYFTAAELSALYYANPAWAALEAQVYGDILRLEPMEPGCWYMVDQRLRLLAASPEAVALWGMPHEAVIGRPLLELFPKARGSESIVALERCLRTRERRRMQTFSPTYETPVEIEFLPQTAGLQVRFALSPAGEGPTETLG